MSKLKRIFLAASQILVYLALFIPAILFCKRKHYWLVSERGDDARDNGYWMFKYLRGHHPEINVVYVIDSKSVDAPKVQTLGKTLRKGCLMHWLIFIAADVRMSTHLFLFAPAPYAGQWIKRHHSKQSINVDLQHGITHNRFPSTYKEINGCDLYVCGAKPEYDWVIQEFHWDEKSAVYTGFARFDGMHDFRTKTQILIMPSWRTELRDVDEAIFVKSAYFKHWNGLLNNPELVSLLETNDLTIIFYIHYSLKKFAHLFTTPSPRIIRASFEASDVQRLLKESKLLITDYSSVFFDFAYMHKPLIYYQFDYEDFYSKHYQRGYFNHAKDGFGPVASKETEVIEDITDLVNDGLAMAPEYTSRINAFFPVYDTNNCERIYNAIVQKQNENKAN